MEIGSSQAAKEDPKIRPKKDFYAGGLFGSRIKRKNQYQETDQSSI